jgi:hypothetical protein
MQQQRIREEKPKPRRRRQDEDIDVWEDRPVVPRRSRTALDLLDRLRAESDWIDRLLRA